MFASLSIYGLWEYDNTVFDNMVLPADLEEHRQDLISEILLDCSDFALLYPDADFMKMLIGVWSRNEQRIWEKMLESELVEFNPIENYDRYETLTRTSAAQRNEDSTGSTSRADRSSETGSAGRLETGNSTGNETGSTGTSRSETSSAESSRTGESSSAAAANADNRTGQTAYDSDSIKDTVRAISTSANSGRSSESGSDRSSGVNALHETGNTDSSTSSTEARSTSDTARRDTDSTGTQVDSERKTGSETGTETVVNHMHGNIGVTTAAEMLAGFREISNFCTVKFIVDSFKDRFCVQVY